MGSPYPYIYIIGLLDELGWGCWIFPSFPKRKHPANRIHYAVWGTLQNPLIGWCRAGWFHRLGSHGTSQKYGPVVRLLIAIVWDTNQLYWFLEGLQKNRHVRCSWVTYSLQENMKQRSEWKDLNRFKLHAPITFLTLKSENENVFLIFVQLLPEMDSWKDVGVLI